MKRRSPAPPRILPRKDDLLPVFTRAAGGLCPFAVRILNDEGLTRLTRCHPHNGDIFLPQGLRSKDFPLYLSSTVRRDFTYFVICDAEERIIAAATLRPDAIRPATEIIFSQISVGKTFRNKGLATRIIAAVRDYLNDYPSIKRLCLTGYTRRGRAYIRGVFHTLADGFRAELYETEPTPLIGKKKV